MVWFGKFVGGAFGFLLGGPLGAVLGAAVGHQLDRGLHGVGLLESDAEADGQRRIQMAFFTATFSVMGHIAKADGRVTEAEIRTARAMMTRMELPEELRRTAVRLFNEGKRPDFPFDATLDQFRTECHGRYSLLRVFIEIQLESAFADGALHEIEERLLLRLCERLRFSRFEFHTIKARMEAERRFSRYSRQHRRSRRDSIGSREVSPAEAYAVLGVAATATDHEIKRAYRRLMSQHHPDKLVSNGLPEEMVKIATEKTQQIRKAYDLISKARNL